MDRKTPFHIKRVDRPKVRISPSAGLEAVQVRINMLLHERKISHFDALRTSTRLRIESEMLRDSKPHLSEEFIRLLRFTSHPASFFPDDILSTYHARSYYLLLERGIAREVLELWGQDIHRSRMVGVPGYQLQVVIAPIIREEAYLVAKNKYSVYLYPRCDSDGIRVYRSDFMDVARATPPALTFHSQDVLEALQVVLAQHLGVPLESITPEPAEEVLEQCPLCNGPVQHLGGKAHFCLECDWDNLAAIPPDSTN